MSPPKAVLQLVFQTLALLSTVLPLAFASSVLSPSVDHQASLQAQPLCRQTTIPVNVVAHRFISLSTPKNQSQVVALLTNLTSIKSNLTADIVHEPRVLNATYNIWTVLCFPLFTRARTVEFAIHGYANAAVEAGHAIFMYDRLGMHAIIIASLSSGTLSGVVNSTNPGVGRSDKPDGIQEVQHDTEIEVAVSI
ncbi:hypothetical protein CVT26_008209 [Gymnopilus dilepis]|uniref:Uncharacterized protein n=1 Tax=Gymnopilus dilepis TaxID=231916 RepID=A0A409XX63_9AGAR|nr:hypothetical protein CVT26_008209 [Gymnopilus dilepis]